MTRTPHDHLKALLTAFYADHQAHLHDAAATDSALDVYASVILTLLSEDLFLPLITASPAYVTRFGGRVTREGALRKMHEEFEEVMTAVGAVLLDDTDRRPMSMRLKMPDQLKRELAGEAIDLLVTLGGVLDAMQTPPEMIVSEARATLAKLDARTDDTHTWHEETLTVIARAKLEGAK